MLQTGVQQPAKPEKYKPATGAGSGIIGISEVVESDIATAIATAETDEADAQMEYDKATQSNKVTAKLKGQDLENKTKEFRALDKLVTELTSEKETSTSEMNAVNDYDAKLKDRCIAKPETYEQRSKRRAAEIAGLKEALAILSSESLLQRGVQGRRSRST